MKQLLLLISSLSMFGCAQNSGVIPMGNDKYMVSRQAATGFTGMGTLKADALKEAAAYCQSKQKALEVLKVIEAQPPFVMGNFPKSEVQFECVE
ncbi:hypothetical protein [Gallaecimonas xiamenensis]|uniref:Lipoprotein n=1 Tax=Gallaecimonas xiamenensis 3-C-1 TaxID=745411 RepID=K2JFW1_9GAMM|nr:hypothetical protein [Gallaecimonas xiamenensis]EKE69549.1 hypothetical protein B3C1_14687 [Gallaecimonas xiamenensis 3-C-1]